MKSVKKIILCTLMMLTTAQILSADSWRSYFSNWNSSTLSRWAASTMSWAGRNPKATAAIASGLTAATVACYLYKKSCDAETRRLNEQAKQLLAENIRGLREAHKRDKQAEQLLNAARNDKTEEVKQLLDSGANINAVNVYGNTPLHIAVNNKQVALATLLLERNADPNTVNDHGWTPLHSAVRYGETTVVRSLLEHKANQNATLPHKSFLMGWTPLHVAAKEGHIPIAQLLLENGADFKLVNAAGQTPQDLAAQDENQEIADFLQKWECYSKDATAKCSLDN